MITIQKGIMLFLGTHDIYNCHWVDAVKTELKEKDQDYVCISSYEFFPSNKTVRVPAKKTG